jgi:hypothetical protein
LEEILRIETENRAWNKRLRLDVTALVESRLAKHISQEEYAARRLYANEAAAECRRRATILVHQIRNRNGVRNENPAFERQRLSLTNLRP